MKKVLLTGAAGFIGFHISKRLFDESFDQFCIDSLNEYYDVSLKEDRLSLLKKYARKKNSFFDFSVVDLRDQSKVEKIVEKYKPDVICHVAAQAGVRYSIENPHEYLSNNIDATLNLLEAARKFNINQFVFASTSSVYGLDSEQPFKESSSANSPESSYAATKKACEMLCHVYHKIYAINFRILRFFTVYGPWGRPDMAPMIFTKSIIEGKSISIFNKGEMERDFTFIDDIVAGFFSAINSKAKFEIINLGNGHPVNLMDFINILESKLDKKAIKNYLEMQPGDVKSTFADITKAKEILNYEPKVSIEEGVTKFVEWYLKYYNA